MIRHCVLVRFRGDVPAEAIAGLFERFAGLKAVIPGILDVVAGGNVSPERLDRGYRHGFIIDFVDAAARDAYLDHPAHAALGAELVSLLDGGIDGLAVVDIQP